MFLCFKKSLSLDASSMMPHDEDMTWKCCIDDDGNEGWRWRPPSYCNGVMSGPWEKILSAILSIFMDRISNPLKYLSSNSRTWECSLAKFICTVNRIIYLPFSWIWTNVNYILFHHQMLNVERFYIFSENYRVNNQLVV